MTNTTRQNRFAASRWLGSVRVRATVVALLIVVIAFVPSALGVVLLLRDSLYTSAANTAQAEALNITSFITTRGRVPLHLSIAADDEAAQVVAPDGNIVASSRNVTGQPAMITLQLAPNKVATRSGVVLHPRRFTHVDLDLDYRFVIAAVGFRKSTFAGTVLVAESLGAADHAVGLVVGALEIGLGLLAVLVGTLIWILTGWALGPVEVIRSEVAGISAMDLHRRVPEPAVRDEIGRLARTMNAMLERLEASNEQQRQLIADVSHELRNPLASLRAQLEVAAAHPDDTTESLFEGSVMEVNRMSRLVEDLLTLARLDEGMLTLHLGEVDLDEIVFVHADRLRAHGKVEVSVAGVSAARLIGDESRLDQVVANLADNAERHATRHVRFALASRDGYARLTVTDDGEGVPPDQRHRIFERFVRLDYARNHQGNGAGLGLAIVREIVHTHGGDVWVEDAEPGARFVAQLPIVNVLKPSRQSPEHRLHEGRGSPGESRGERHRNSRRAS
jgi:signal transduction histidine kinase